MPYASVGDLPARVKNHLPSHAQKIFLNVWNSVYKQTGDETRAFKAAWSKAHANYGQPGDKMWKKDKPFKYQAAGKSNPGDIFDVVKSRQQKPVQDTDKLWTKMHKRPKKAPSREGRVTVRPTEFEFDMPFFDKDLRDTIQDIPGAHLEGNTTWVVPINNDSVTTVAKMLANKEIYMVDWIELERDAALQKQRAENHWGDVPVKDHGKARPGAKKGRGTAAQIDAAKSVEEDETMNEPLEKAIRDNDGAFYSEYEKGGSQPVRQHRIKKYKNPLSGKTEFQHEMRYLRTHDEGNARTGLGEGGGKAGTMSDWEPSHIGFKSHQDALADMAHMVLYKQHMANNYTTSRDVKIHHAGLKNAVSKARKALPYRQESLPMGKSEESDAVAALAKSVGYAAAPPVPLVFSRHGHPANSQACSTCGGLGYIFIESVNDPIGDPNAEAATPDMEQQAVADARNTQFVVDPTTANPDVTDDNNPILLSEESAAPVTGRSCLSCKRTTVEAATFMKLPDSGYCDDCLTSSVARRR